MQLQIFSKSIHTLSEEYAYETDRLNGQLGSVPLSFEIFDDHKGKSDRKRYRNVPHPHFHGEGKQHVQVRLVRPRLAVEQGSVHVIQRAWIVNNLVVFVVEESGANPYHGCTILYLECMELNIIAK